MDRPPSWYISIAMLEPGIYELCQADNFGVLTTTLPSGRAMTHVMWIDCDERYVFINTEVHRKKFENMKRDPRVTVTVWDHSNPYRFGEVRGDVVGTITGDEARRHIDKLSRKYGGKDYPSEAITTERVIVKIEPVRQIFRG